APACPANRSATGETAALPVAVTLGNAVQVGCSATKCPAVSSIAARRRPRSNRSPSTNITHWFLATYAGGLPSRTPPGDLLALTSACSRLAPSVIHGRYTLRMAVVIAARLSADLAYSRARSTAS